MLIQGGTMTSGRRYACSVSGSYWMSGISGVWYTTFPGGVAVDATCDGHLVHTDQPIEDGGTGGAMSPFDLFFASIATCMGFYALRFCQQRGISTEGLGLTLEPVRKEDDKQVTLVRIALQLPLDFPEKYMPAMERAIDHCAVKKHIAAPPRFELDLVPSPYACA